MTTLFRTLFSTAMKSMRERIRSLATVSHLWNTCTWLLYSYSFIAGYMARSQAQECYMENTTAKSGRGEGAYYYELERYDKGQAYVIRG